MNIQYMDKPILSYLSFKCVFFNQESSLTVIFVKLNPFLLENVLANLGLNADIFGCKGVYYPRSKLFSRQSKPKRGPITYTPRISHSEVWEPKNWNTLYIQIDF